MIFLKEPKFASILLIIWPVSNSQGCSLTFPVTLTNPTSGIRNWVQAKASVVVVSKTALSLFSVLSQDPGRLSSTLSVEGSPAPSPQPPSKTKVRVPGLMPAAISAKTSSNLRCHSPNLSKASAIAWFFTISMSPRPRQKCGKMRKTDFRISLMLFSFYKNKTVGDWMAFVV